MATPSNRARLLFTAALAVIFGSLTSLVVGWGLNLAVVFPLAKLVTNVDDLLPVALSAICLVGPIAGATVAFSIVLVVAVLSQRSGTQSKVTLFAFPVAAAATTPIASFILSFLSLAPGPTTWINENIVPALFEWPSRLRPEMPCPYALAQTLSEGIARIAA